MKLFTEERQMFQPYKNVIPLFNYHEKILWYMIPYFSRQENKKLLADFLVNKQKSPHSAQFGVNEIYDCDHGIFVKRLDICTKRIPSWAHYVIPKAMLHRNKKWALLYSQDPNYSIRLFSKIIVWGSYVII